MQEEQVEKMLENMSVEDLCGQLICLSAGREKSEGYEKMVQRVHPGGIFVSGVTREHIKYLTDAINSCTEIPVIVAADIENGAGCCIPGEHVLPEPMAWGACDNVDLIRKTGRVTGEICRKNGIHWNFAPIVDINYNKDNPVTNTRAISDSPEQVARIAEAYVEGMQTNQMLLAGCKHFPGDGMDDRNQHFCTTINSLSKEEWMETYGYVYKKMFAAGAASVMVGHIALPAIEDEIDPILGPKPGTLSKKIMTELLRNELGFEGCIVSDAMSMVGACSMCPLDRQAIEFINAGGDMILFAQEKDFNYLVEAVHNGEISMERLKDAVRHILRMKMRAGLLDGKDSGDVELSGDISELSLQIARESITVVRNSQNHIPLKLKAGARILMITMKSDDLKAVYIRQLTVVEEELRKRGYDVTVKSALGLDHRELEETKAGYDCILICCRISARDYWGGTLRVNRDNIMPFWRGAAIDHPCMIFVSFGDPYKLYDFPFLRNYVNCYSSQDDTQKAFVEVLLGEKPCVGKNPVALKGFFEREV